MAQANLTTLGWVYIGLTAGWSVILLGGMAFLYYHRRLPFLQLRRLPLVFSAIILLHLYGSACMAAYTIGPLIPCDAQFWIMSIYLPFGMALLQAANSQFQHVASQQRKYARLSSLDEHKLSDKALPLEPSLNWWKRLVVRFRRTDKTTKIVIYIVVAIVVESVLTFFIYFGSEIFHPSYGIFNVKVPGTERQRQQLCVEGWEWWLSIVWQFFWAWIYAPYMLWKTRNTHDTHGWRVQTICCCVAGLPASPLWLAALYIPQMAPVNAVMVPPQWFAYSIFLIEVFTIFFPCWQVIKTHSLQQETLDAISTWEQQNKARNGTHDEYSMSSAAFGGTTIGGDSLATGKSGRSSASAELRERLGMVSLENALQRNAQALLEFAALKDFSGENVSFLCHLSEWKRTWACSDDADQRNTRIQFVRAVQIYSHFVSLELSEFPVNISSREGKGLHSTFDRAAQLLNYARRPSIESDSITPFDGASEKNLRGGSSGSDLEDTLGRANLDSVAHMSDLSAHDELDIPIPESFGPHVFDSAEKEIKYLVLTNTWPKFVHAGLDSASQTEPMEVKLSGSNFRKHFFCV